MIEIKTPGEYSLTLNGSDEDNNATGDLDILQSLTILNDTNGGSVTIEANGLTSPDRVFDVGPNGEALSVTIKGVTIQNGSAPAGGAIRVPSPSDLTLENDVDPEQHGRGRWRRRRLHARRRPYPHGNDDPGQQERRQPVADCCSPATARSPSTAA